MVNYFLTPEERLKGAERTLSPGIKTRDVGTCNDCGAYTTSGANMFCEPCATAIVEAHKAGGPILMPSIQDLKSARR